MIYKQRNLYYDILRVFALFLVIGVHSLGSITKFTSRHSLFIVLMNTINQFGVPIFFSLSGFFSLNNNVEDVFKWYKKRAKRLLLPLLVYSSIYVFYFIGYEQNNYIGIPVEYILALILGNTHPTHWFVFTLIGLTFATPYLKIMFDSISEKTICFFYLFLLFYLMVNNVLSVFNLKLGINTLVFDNYFVLLYISGYCVNKIKNFNIIKFVIRYKYFIIALLYICKVNIVNLR